MEDSLAPPIDSPPARHPVDVLARAALVVVFVLSVAVTVWFWRAMPADMDMAMPGGWTMSMMWSAMPRQSWLGAALVFLAMWEAMMVAMMLPSAAPMLLIYRRLAAFRGEPRRGLCTWALGTAYFLVWLGIGVVAYALGAGLSAAAMRWAPVSRAVPLAAGLALLACGAFQMTRWKMACLKHCRDPMATVATHATTTGWHAAWRLGLHHGLFCAGCCWALMLAQLILGVMSLSVMAIIAGAIAVEKLLPRGEALARVIGAAMITGGAWVLVHALR